MHFVRTFSIMRAEAVRLIAMEEVRNYGKIVCINNIFENGWWEDAHLSSYPIGSTLGHMLRKTRKGLAYFNHLAPLVLFFFTKKQSKRGWGGAWHNGPLLNTLVNVALMI